MKKHNKEIIKLAAKEILLSLIDVPMAGLYLFDGRRYYRKSISSYFEDRSYDRGNFLQKIKYLKRRGLVTTFIEGNEKYIELTQKGFENLDKIKFENLSVKRPKKWDGKFRIVIFDIPEDKKDSRDLLRRKIESIGFRQIQKSVFAYPFECHREIALICEHYSVTRFLKYIVADIIEGEDEVIEFFLDRGVLELSDLDN